MVFLHTGCPCELDAVSCKGVVVTAADRAAATCQRWIRAPSIRGSPKVSKGRSESPLVASAEAKSPLAPSAEDAVIVHRA